MKIVGIVLALATLVSAQGILTHVGDSNQFFLYPTNPPDGIPAVYAQLSSADAIARDANGNIYVALPTLIRRIDAATGMISTVAGTGLSQIVTGTAEQGPARQSVVSRGGYGSIVIAPDGGLLFLSGSFSGSCLKRFDPGTNTVKVIVGNCTLSSGPAMTSIGVVVAADGTAYVQQTSYPQSIYRVDVPTGAATLIAGGGSAGGSISPDGVPALNAVIDVSAGIAVDSQKNVYFADLRRVRKVDAVTGILSTVAGSSNLFSSSGDGGLATQAGMFLVTSIASNPAGDLFIGDLGRIRLVRKNTGIIDTIAGIDLNRSNFNGDNLLAKETAISSPKSIVVNGDDVYFVDMNNAYRVRKITGATGRITTLAGGVAGNGDGGFASGAVYSGIQSMVADKAGNIFLNDYSTIRRIDKVTGLINTFAGGGSNSTDGATGKDANIQQLSNLVFDAQGNLLFTNGSRIRKLDALARLSTVAGTDSSSYSGEGKYASQASFSSTMGDLVVDSRGNIFVADTGNCRVRRIDYVSNLVTTIAGNGDCLGQPVEGAATQSPMRPVDLAIGQNDDVYINTGNNVWRVDSTGLLHAFAGNGFNAEGGDGGTASAASFNALDILFDRGQNLLIVGDNRVRRIDKTTNIIQTVAGGGTQSLSSTGVSALTASFTPNASTVEDGNDLLIPASEGLFRLSPYVVPPLSQAPSSFVFRDPTNLRVEGLNPGSILSLTGNYLAPEEGWGTTDDTGQLTKSIKGVRVFMGDAVPLLYVSPAVIHLVMPTSFTLGKVRVETPYGSQSVQPTLINGNPGVSIFPAPILNPDGSSNGPLNPAKSGDVLTMFATNVGPVTPEGRDGTIVRQAPGGSLPTYVRPVTAKITTLSGANPVSAEASISPATGYISELARLSVRLPNNLPTGPASLSVAATLSTTTFGQPVTVYVTANATTPKIPPQISSISPKTIAPLIHQLITITGTGFEPGLSIQLYLNGKTDRVVSGSAISAITSTSFNADVVLDSAGTWEFEVVSPSAGRSPSRAVVVVPERRSGMPVDPAKLRTR